MHDMRVVRKKRRPFYLTPTRIGILLLAILAFVVIVYGPLYSQYRDLKQRHLNLLYEILKVKKEVDTLDHEKYLLEHDVRHLERVMREELGLAKPGEEIYRFKLSEESIPAESDTGFSAASGQKK